MKMFTLLFCMINTN